MTHRVAQSRISLFPWVRITEIENSNELPRCSTIQLCLSTITLISTESSQLNSFESKVIGSRKGKQTSLKIFTIVKSLFTLPKQTEKLKNRVKTVGISALCSDGNR